MMVSTFIYVDTYDREAHRVVEAAGGRAQARRPQPLRQGSETGVDRSLPAAGVSVARMGLQHGINANLLRTWITRYRRQCAGQPPALAVSGTTAFVPVVAAEVAPQKCAVRLGAELPNGIKLELGAADAGDLAVLLRLLCELPCSGLTPD